MNKLFKRAADESEAERAQVVEHMRKSLEQIKAGNFLTAEESLAELTDDEEE